MSVKLKKRNQTIVHIRPIYYSKHLERLGMNDDPYIAETTFTHKKEVLYHQNLGKCQAFQELKKILTKNLSLAKGTKPAQWRSRMFGSHKTHKRTLGMGE